MLSLCNFNIVSIVSEQTIDKVEDNVSNSVDTSNYCTKSDQKSSKSRSFRLIVNRTTSNVIIEI